MKAHDISQQAAREPSATPTKRQTGKAKETKAAAKKRKAAESDAGEDDKEANPKLKKVKEDPKARKIVIISEARRRTPATLLVARHSASWICSQRDEALRQAGSMIGKMCVSLENSNGRSGS